MHTSRRATPGTVVGALFTVAIAATAWQGHTTIAVLLGLNGVLITGYLVRHRMRSRLIYGKHPDVPADQAGAPNRAATMPPRHTAPPARQHVEPAGRQARTF